MVRKNMTPDNTPQNRSSREELKSFLTRIWSYKSKLAQCYTIMAIYDNVPMFKHFCLDEYESFDQLLEAVADHVEHYGSWAEGAHIYYQVLPLARRPSEGRGKAEDVAIAKVLFADFDFKEPLRGKPDGVDSEEVRCNEGEDHELDCVYREGKKWYHIKRPPLKKFLEQFKQLGDPSFIVDSGGGYHVYYFLNEEVEAEKFKRLQDRFVDVLKGADQHARDLARVLRLPGTVNPRTGRMCRVIYESNNTYSYDELKQKLLELQQKARTQEVEPPQPEKTSPKPRKDIYLRELDSTLLPRVKELLLPAYVEGHRQNLCLYLSGWAAKARISPVSVARIIYDLHKKTEDEEPLARRLQALTYSYVKAGIDLTPYLDEIERATGVRLRLPDPRALGEVELKGRAGIQEILEQVMQDDDKALSTLQELTDIFGISSPFPGDSVFAPLDEVRRIYAVADYKRMKMGQAKLDEQDEKGKIKLSPIVAEVVPVRTILYKNPFTRTELFEMWFDGPGAKGRDPPIKIGPVTGDAIPALAQERLLIKSTKEMFAKILSAIFTKLLELGRVEIKEMLPETGVFLSKDGRIVLSKYEVHDIDKEKLRASLQLLNELATLYNRKKFATVVKWGAAAPFTFLRKQLGYWTRWIFLHGHPKTGKTTLGRIVVHLWGLKTALDPSSKEETRHERTAAGANTPARLGMLLSSTTFPMVFNEAEDMLLNPSMVAMIKGAIDSDYARGIVEGKRYRDFYSMASAILTSNAPFIKQLDPQTVESLSRRMIVITFNILEKIPSKAEKEFNEKYRPRLSQLSEVGNCIMNIALKQGVSFFDRDITEIELGKELLKRCYEVAELPLPSWIEEEYDTSESSLYEVHFVEQFRNNARLIILKAYHDHYVKLGHDVNIPIEERLLKAIVEELARGLTFNKTREVRDENGRIVLIEGEVVITKDFLDTLGLTIELETLAHALGWRYSSIRVPKAANVDESVLRDWMRVIKVDLKKFISFLQRAEDVQIELSSSSNSQASGQDSQGAAGNS